MQTKSVYKVPPSNAVYAFKAFDGDMACRGVQFAVGGTYKHKGPLECCHSGFHACEHPLHMLDHYPPVSSRFGIVELSGDIHRHGTKIAGRKLTVKTEIDISTLVNGAFAYALHGAKLQQGPHSTNDECSVFTNAPKRVASVTGQGSVVQTNNFASVAAATEQQAGAKTTDRWSVACVTGRWSAALAKADSSIAASTGYQSGANASERRSIAATTGHKSVVTVEGVGSIACTTGDGSRASADGDYSVANAAGDHSAVSVTGKNSVAVAAGRDDRAMASEGSAIFLVRRNRKWEITHVFAGIAGRDGIAADTWYILDENGQPTIRQDQ